jgi:hypothetical protein
VKSLYAIWGRENGYRQLAQTLRWRHVKDDGFEKEGTMTLSGTPKTNTEKTTKDFLIHLRINQ